MKSNFASADDIMSSSFKYNTPSTYEDQKTMASDHKFGIGNLTPNTLQYIIEEDFKPHHKPKV